MLPLLPPAQFCHENMSCTEEVTAFEVAAATLAPLPPPARRRRGGRRAGAAVGATASSAPPAFLTKRRRSLLTPVSRPPELPRVGGTSAQTIETNTAAQATATAAATEATGAAEAVPPAVPLILRQRPRPPPIEVPEDGDIVAQAEYSPEPSLLRRSPRLLFRRPPPEEPWHRSVGLVGLHVMSDSMSCKGSQRLPTHVGTALTHCLSTPPLEPISPLGKKNISFSRASWRSLDLEQAHCWGRSRNVERTVQRGPLGPRGMFDVTWHRYMLCLEAGLQPCTWF